LFSNELGIDVNLLANQAKSGRKGKQWEEDDLMVSRVFQKKWG
jgi:hypothetical protein